MCSGLFQTFEKDVKILSFGDVVLYASDLKTLLPGMWVNDNIISFACEYMLSKASNEIKGKVLFVLNDRVDTTSVGGSHWSLLILDRKKAVFRYYDSMNASKEAVARQLINILTPLLKGVQHSFVVEDCAQQCNSFDCGMYVIEFVRQELELANASLPVLVDTNYINTQRQHWRNIINSLSLDR